MVVPAFFLKPTPGKSAAPMLCSPLGRGCLTGKIDENTTHDSTDIRSRNPRFTPQAIQANRVVIDLLERIGAQHEATPAQIALAWLRHIV